MFKKQEATINMYFTITAKNQQSLRQGYTLLSGQCPLFINCLLFILLLVLFL